MLPLDRLAAVKGFSPIFFPWESSPHSYVSKVSEMNAPSEFFQ